ncbi:MAG TPA: biotin/lipoyl-containing protein [Thermoanaerobaculia bacterium]|nr:biotin/lipoyl-containing protein [Thermoanaerobaculia bacterium]
MRRSVLFLKNPGGDPSQVVVERRGAGCRVARDGHRDDFDASRLPDGRYSLLFEDGRQVSGRVQERPEGVRVFRRGEPATVSMSRGRPSSASLAAGAGEGGVEEIRALMHGRIVEVRFAAGDRVEPGALLLVLEAMKMQNEIRASRGGVVERCEVEQGQTVEGGAFLLSIRSDNN